MADPRLTPEILAQKIKTYMGQGHDLEVIKTGAMSQEVDADIWDQAVGLLKIAKKEEKTEEWNPEPVNSSIEGAVIEKQSDKTINNTLKDEENEGFHADPAVSTIKAEIKKIGLNGTSIDVNEEKKEKPEVPHTAPQKEEPKKSFWSFFDTPKSDQLDLPESPWKNFWLWVILPALGATSIFFIIFIKKSLASLFTYNSYLNTVLISDDTFNLFKDFSINNTKYVELLQNNQLLFITTLSAISILSLIPFLLRKYTLNKDARTWKWGALFIVAIICFYLFLLNPVLTDNVVPYLYIILIGFFLLLLSVYFETKGHRKKLIPIIVLLFLIYGGIAQKILFSPIQVREAFEQASINFGGYPINFLYTEGYFVAGIIALFLGIGICLIKQISIFAQMGNLKKYLQLLAFLLPLSLVMSYFISYIPRSTFSEYMDYKKMVSEELDNLRGDIITDPDFSVTLLKNAKNQQNILFIERKTCNLPFGAGSNVDIPISSGTPLLNCEKLVDFWEHNKYLSNAVSDILVQEVAYHYLRSGQFDSFFNLLNAPIEEHFRYAKEQQIKMHNLGNILGSLTLGNISKTFGVLSPRVSRVYQKLSRSTSARLNFATFKRAGFNVKPFTKSDCPLRDCDELYKNKYFKTLNGERKDRMGYSKEDYFNKDKFATGIISGGEIHLNGKPFTGNLELFRPKIEKLSSIFAPKGLIPVKDGKIESFPIMVGEYLIGIRLDDYFDPNKLQPLVEGLKPTIPQSKVKTLYEFQATNLPDVITVNKKNTRFDLGKIDIWVAEKGKLETMIADHKKSQRPKIKKRPKPKPRPKVNE